MQFTAHKPIKFFDLSYQNKILKKEISKKIIEIFDTGQYSHGKYCQEFEENWAKHCGAKYCVLTGSGTVALELALRCLDLENKTILTSPFSFIATSNAITYVNSRLIFQDVDDTANLNIYDKSLQDIKAIVPVSMYGNCCDLDKINNAAKKLKIPVIHDACQAHFSTYKNRLLGSSAVITCYSFYCTKILGGISEGGCLITNDTQVYERAKCLRNHGRNKEGYDHIRLGYNFRNCEINAAILNIKLKYMDRFLSERNVLINRYIKNLQNHKGVRLLKVENHNYCPYYIFPIRIKNRDLIKRELLKKEISTMIHYSPIIPLQPCYKHLQYNKNSFPIAESFAQEELSLPLFNGLSLNDVDRVSENILQLNAKFNH